MTDTRTAELMEKLKDEPTEFKNTVLMMLDYKNVVDSDIMKLRLRKTMIEAELLRLEEESTLLEKLYYPKEHPVI